MEIITKNKFEKDIKRLKKRQKDFSKLEIVIKKLIEGTTLEDKYKNHLLVGNWQPCYELHLEPDWLLIYQITKAQLTLYRTGTHSYLF